MRIHLIVLAVELTIVTLLGIAIALDGARSAKAQQQRGADLNARRELSFERERLRTALEWETRPLRLEAAVRRLELPLQPGRPEAVRGTMVVNR